MFTMLVYINGTFTVGWFSGGPIFRVVHPAYIGYNLTTSTAREWQKVLLSGGFSECLEAFSVHDGYHRYWKQLTLISFSFGLSHK